MSKDEEKGYLRHLDRNFILEASAGTGKTSAILKRMVCLVNHLPDFKMSELVAITFTEKATIELRAKIRHSLEQERAQSKEEKTRQKFNRLISEFEQAQISTIHSFSANLLRRRPVEAGVSPAFQVLDETESGFLFEKTWEKWLEAKLKEESELDKELGLFRQLRMAEIEPEDIKELTLELYKNRDLYKLNRKILLNLEETISFEEAEKQFYSLYTRLKKEDPKAKRFNRGFDDFNHLLKLFSPQPEKVWLQFSSEDLEKGEFLKRHPAGSGIKEKLMEIIEQLGSQYLAELLNYIDDFFQVLEAEKRKAEVLDFQDLLLKAVQLLRDNQEAREFFKRKFKYILVDEFQDTDPLQVELIFFLGEKKGEFAKDWRKVNLEPGKLFIVGDPKQSIYRFRRADLEIYEQAKDVLLNSSPEGIEPLEENHRSHPGILNWVNQTFKEQFQPEPGIQPGYQPLSPANPDSALSLKPPLTKPVIILELESENEEKLKVDIVRKTEAQAVCDFIEWAVGNLKVRDKISEPDTEHPAQYKHFAILYPAHNEAKFIIDELKAREIPFQSDTGGDFLEKDEILGLISIFKLINNPMDEVSLISALRSIFLAVSDMELLNYKRANFSWNWLEAKPNEKKFPALSSAFIFLKELYQAKERVSISILIERIMEHSKIGKIRKLDFRFNQILLNLERIKALARQMESSEAFSLYDWVLWLEGLSGEGLSWSELFAKESNNAVSLMTYHKSKGLEFPIVILTDLCHKLNYSPATLLKDWRQKKLAISLDKFYTLNFDEMKEKDKTHNQAERIRNLYVACTRAKQYLVIPDPRKIYNTKSSYLGLLESGLPQEEGATLELEKIIEIKSAKNFKREKTKIKKKKPELLIFAEQKANSTKLEQEKISFAQAHRGKWEQARKTIQLVAPSAEEADWQELEGGKGRDLALEKGAIVHQVIEQAGNQDLETALCLAQRLAKEKGLEEELPDIENLIKNFWQSQFKKFLYDKKCFQEVPFFLEAEDKIYRGRIDLVFRQEQGLGLVDFKTDRITPEQVDKYSERYLNQMSVYQKALSNLKGEKISQAILYYLRLNLPKKI